MYDLFNPAPEGHTPSQTLTEICFSEVKGLRYIKNFLTADECATLIAIIKQQSWLSDIKRRVQHYGYKYDYKARNIDNKMFLGELPIWAADIGLRLFREGLIEDIPDQVIVNEYLPGQGIANHIDCEPCFGETIISISLCSTCIMDFTNILSKKRVEVFLEPGSLVVINNDARHVWTHGIQPRKSDTWDGRRIERQVRISMTYRKVILHP